MRKILVSDFDNTLFCNNLNDLAENIKEIHTWMKLGNLFVIATGRSYPGIIETLQEYGISYDYLICNDGAKIFYQNGKEIYSSTFSLKEKKAITNLLAQDREISHYQIDTGYHYGEDLEDEICTIRAFPKSWQNSAQKLSFFREQLPDNHIYLSTNSFHFLPAQNSKKNAIYSLIQQLKMDPDQVYTIGDSDNDYEMVKTFHGNTIKGSILQEKYSSFPQYNRVCDLMKALEKEC